MAFTLATGPVEGFSGAFTPSQTLTGRVSGGGIIVVAFANGSGGTINVPTAPGETFTAAGTQFNGTSANAIKFAAFFCNSAGSGDLVISDTGTGLTGDGLQFIAMQLNQAVAFDAQGGTSATATANPTTSVTTTANNDFIIGITVTSGPDPTAGGTYVLITIGDAFNNTSGEYTLDAGTSGATSVPFVSTSGNWDCYAAAFKAAGGGDVLMPQIWM